MHTHICTYIHSYTDPCGMCIFTCVYPYARMTLHLHTCLQTLTRICARSHVQICMHDCTHTHLCALTRVYTDTDTCPGMLTHMHAYTPVPMCTENMSTGTDTHLCTLKYMHTYICGACMRTCLCGLTHPTPPMCTYTRTYSDICLCTHTCACIHRRAHPANQPV